jgi:ABC-type sugar transport system substrate-binding protein
MEARMIRRGVALLIVPAIAVAAAGCGKVKGIEAQDGAQADRAEKAGKQAAADAGPEVKLPPVTVALLTMNGKDESSNRLKTQLEEVSKKELGWVPSPCDGKGSPMELETCATGVIDQGPLDVIVTHGVDPKLIPRTLRKAKFKNIPVVNIGAAVPRRRDSPLLAADFAPDDRAQTKKLDGYMIRRLKRVPPASRRIVVLKSTGPGGKVRFDQLEKDIEGTGIKIVGEGEIDPKKPDTSKETVKGLLEKHKNLKAVWVADGNSVELAGKAVDKAFKDLSFPDRPLVLGFNADPKAAEAIRDGEADAVADVPYEASLWIALDRVAELIGRDEQLSSVSTDDYPLDFMDVALVTKDNAPAKKKFREPKEDFVTFFTEKWKLEFGSPLVPG